MTNDKTTNDKTTNEKTTSGITIPKDDPRRLLHAGDEAVAYPEHALYRLHEREIEACRAFYRDLHKHGMRICAEPGEDTSVYDEAGYFTGDVTIYFGAEQSRIERAVFATFDIHYDDFDREKKAMLYLWNGQNPPDEPSAKPFTLDEARAIGEEIQNRYAWRHVAKLHYFQLDDRADDGTAAIVVAFYHPDVDEQSYRTCTNRKEFRSVVAQLAEVYANAKQGKKS